MNITIGDIYKLTVKKGIEADRRSKEEIGEFMHAVYEEYSKIPQHRKPFFDKMRLVNPYDDTRIIYGDRRKPVKTIAVGIDVDVSTLLLINELRKKKNIDLVITHHPIGYARQNIFRVVHMKSGIWDDYGVPEDESAETLSEASKEIKLDRIGKNFDKVENAAKLLGIPLMTMHTPADNFVSRYMQELVDNTSPLCMEDLTNILYGQPEFLRVAKDHLVVDMIMKNTDGPQLGKVFVDMTGGTYSGVNQMLKHFKNNGVQTIMRMHNPASTLPDFEKANINLVVCNHMAGCSMGMNLILDQILPHGIEIIPVSGMVRTGVMARSSMDHFLHKEESECKAFYKKYDNNPHGGSDESRK
jgi:putative NIF3 family GTP cyclohydrolase 1 type 2